MLSLPDSCVKQNHMLVCRLPCSFMSHAVLGSYVVQSQCGDYEPTEHGAGTSYISHMTLAPEQSDELLTKVAELHKTHR